MSNKAGAGSVDAGRHINTAQRGAAMREQSELWQRQKSELKPAEDRTVEWEKEMVSLGK